MGECSSAVAKSGFLAVSVRRMASTPRLAHPWQRFCRSLNPTIDEINPMLRDLNRRLGGWDEVALAIGVPHSTLCRWMWSNVKKLPAGSERVIWLTWQAICRPGQVNTVWHLTTCGRFTKSAGPQHAGRNLPNSRGDFSTRVYGDAGMFTDQAGDTASGDDSAVYGCDSSSSPDNVALCDDWLSGVPLG